MEAVPFPKKLILQPMVFKETTRQPGNCDENCPRMKLKFFLFVFFSGFSAIYI